MNQRATRTLASAILEGHSVRAGEDWEIRPDHVVLDEAAGDFATWVFAEAIGRPVSGVTGMVAADARGASGLVRMDGHSDRLEQRARRSGFHFAPPGFGRCDHAYVDRLAGPGRLAVVAGAGASVAGAVGTLVLPVSTLEAVAASVGAPVAVLAPPIVRVELTGALTNGVSGHDVVVEIAHAFGDRIARHAILEFVGPGLESLGMRDRWSIAMNIGVTGAAAALMPVDESTRAWLLARGRGSDWKPLNAPEAATDEALRVELELVEPWSFRSSEPTERRRVRHMAESRVEAVVIGPGASEADLERMAAWLYRRTMAAGVRCFVVPGSGRALDVVQHEPGRTIFRDAGVRVVASPVVGGVRSGPRGRIFYHGVSAAERLGHGDVASLESCVAALVRGVVADPREVEFPASESIGTSLHGPDGLRPPQVASTELMNSRTDGFPRRLTVAARFGDHLTTDEIVPRGPRSVGLEREDLSLGLLAVGEPQLADRLSAGATCFVARRHALAGPRCEIAAWVLARAGVRLVAASSFAASASRHLAAAGVLALEWPRSGRCGLEPGDEIELAGGLDAVIEGAFVTVRNLARGTQELYRHELSERWIDVLRAGGLVPHAMAAATVGRSEHGSREA